jgi:hypothetical protein
MIVRKTLKTVFGKVNRSGFQYFTTPALPRKRAPETETGYDMLGGLTVVILSAGMVALMRVMLAN